MHGSGNGIPPEIVQFMHVAAQCGPGGLDLQCPAADCADSRRSHAQNLCLGQDLDGIHRSHRNDHASLGFAEKQRVQA